MEHLVINIECDQKIENNSIVKVLNAFSNKKVLFPALLVILRTEFLFITTSKCAARFLLACVPK